MENVCTFPAGSSSQSAAATLEESTPPERKTPRGTSDRRGPATDSLKMSQNRCATLSSGSTPGCGLGNGDSQYRETRILPSSQTRTWPLGNFRSPRQIEWG